MIIVLFSYLKYAGKAKTLRDKSKFKEIKEVEPTR